MQKSRRWRNEDLWESSPQTSICSWGCFTALSHFHPHSAFSSTEIGFSAPFPYLYLPLSIAHTIFCISSVTKAIWKGFVFPVFHTVVLRISIKRAENQRGNKYFLLSLPHCYCIFHSYFTYSVNKEPCQALRLKKKKNWKSDCSVLLEHIVWKRDMYRMATKCVVVTISSIF